jgi:hypothetical protein
MLSHQEMVALSLAVPFEIMKFTLTYDGELPSATRSNGRLAEKWAIRKALHPQLAELWQNSKQLQRAKEVQIPREPYIYVEDHHGAMEAHNKPLKEGFVRLCEPIVVKGRNFIPLVRDSLALACGLEILFLRKEEPGSIISKSGDIDNRLKVLFDALRMPTNEEFAGIEGPFDDDPMHCLLESDSLINDLTVRTDRLLSKPNARASEVRLVMEVRLKVMHVRTYNMGLVGD